MSTAGSEPRRSSAGRLYIVVGTIVAVIAFAAAAGLASLPLLSQSATGAKIVVAKNSITARTRIQLSDLTTMSYAPAPPGFFADVTRVQGKGARVDIPAGAPITANLLVDAPDLLNSSDVSYLPIPQGWVAIQIPTSEQQGVGGYVQVGDRINMLASMNTSQFGQDPSVVTVRTVFRDLNVLRVGPASAQATSPTLTSTLIVLVTACDGEYLYWLLTNAVIKYELESAKDYGSAPTAPDPSCQKPGGVGPKDVDMRWHFTTH
jgi:Flp pilus assembly protein CpaB